MMKELITHQIKQEKYSSCFPLRSSENIIKNRRRDSDRMTGPSNRGSRIIDFDQFFYVSMLINRMNIDKRTWWF